MKRAGKYRSKKMKPCIYNSQKLLRSRFVGKTIERTEYKKNRKNKGADGKQMHKLLGVDDNKQEPDFRNGELKTMPLKLLKNKNFSPKETVSISNYSKQNFLPDFKNTVYYGKMKRTLFILLF